MKRKARTEKSEADIARERLMAAMNAVAMLLGHIDADYIIEAQSCLLRGAQDKGVSL